MTNKTLLAITKESYRPSKRVARFSVAGAFLAFLVFGVWITLGAPV
jgi:hypothetical protein